MGEAGRPTICTPGMIDEVCRHLEQGCSIRTTCKIVGVSMETWSNWQHRGADGEEPFATFVERTTKATGAGIGSLVTVMHKAAQSGDWRAAQALLDRMHPDISSTRTEHTGPEGGPIQVIVSPGLLADIPDDE
jgi:hypothetical protein